MCVCMCVCMRVCVCCVLSLAPEKKQEKLKAKSSSECGLQLDDKSSHGRMDALWAWHAYARRWVCVCVCVEVCKCELYAALYYIITSNNNYTHKPTHATYTLTRTHREISLIFFFNENYLHLVICPFIIVAFVAAAWMKMQINKFASHDNFLLCILSLSCRA